MVPTCITPGFRGKVWVSLEPEGYKAKDVAMTRSFSIGAPGEQYGHQVEATITEGPANRSVVELQISHIKECGLCTFQPHD